MIFLRLSLAVLSVVLLVGCGVDGAPQTPPADPGVTLSGTAAIGISGSL